MNIDQPLRVARADFEREYMQYHHTKHNENITQMAKAIGMERSALHRKLNDLGLEAKKNPRPLLARGLVERG